ncbi:MAG: hypothetical protein GYB66_09600, partial [Chloroflexi bacterium]|nr:hypothetical protein [Chloroflexota bacterium]
MIFSRVRRPIILIVILLLAAALLAACGGDDDEEGSGDSRPTVPSFPTTTTTPGGDEAGTLPTALPTTASGPTPTRFAGFPTLEVAPTIPSRYPNSIQIVSPVAGAQLSGTVTIWGSASHPDFIQYTLEYGPDPNPSGLWYPITPQAVTVPVLNNALGAWNTTQVQDGTYQLRLHVYLTGGREITNVVVTGLRVQNGQPQPTAPSNNAPIISPIAPLTLQRGTSATIALGIYDPDGDPTTFIAASDNTAVASVVPIGQSITVTGNSAGVATIRIRVSDDRGAIAETTFLTTVVQPQQANNPPNIDPVPGQTLTAGATINVPLTITDPDGDTVEFEVSSAAPGIASATAIAGGPSVQITGQTPGTTTVTVTARDARGASRAIAFSVVVNPATANDPPSIAAIPGQSLQEGDTKDIPLSISDPNGDSTSYQVSSNAPNVAGVSDLGGNRIRITGQNEGFASVTVVVEDNRGARASTVFSVTVNAAPPPNQNPTLGALQNQSLEIGQTIQVDLTLNDPDGDPLTVSSTSSDTAIATTGQADSDTLTVTGVGAGEATITVSVGDGRGGSDQETFNVQVSPATQPNQDPNLEPIGSQTVATGQTLIVPLDYSDPDNDNVTVFASSDAPGVASVFQSGPAELTITGASSGTATITVEIEDGRGGTATQSFPVTVEAVNQNPNIAPIPPQSCEAGDALTITLDYNDPDGDPVTANATSNATGVATTSLSDTTLTVDCVAEGVAMITVSVEDDQGGSNTTTFDVAVGAANRNPTIDQIAPQTCDAGDTLNLTLTYSDPDGDTVIPSASSNNPRIATVALQGDALTVNCVASGNATIVVEAEDTQGGSATMSFGVTIGDAAPVNQDPQINPIPPQMCQAGDSLSVDVTASDPDGDTVTLAATSTAPAVADATVAGNTLTINCVAEGTATINLTATDGQGGTATAGVQVTVGAPPNQDPQIDPIPPQTCQAGDAPAVTVTATDPDGDTVTLAATSTAPGVADATVAGTTLTINCVAEGTATINLTATDGQGGTAAAGVQVTVSAPPPPKQQQSIQTIPKSNTHLTQTAKEKEYLT